MQLPCNQSRKYIFVLCSSTHIVHLVSNYPFYISSYHIYYMCYIEKYFYYLLYILSLDYFLEHINPIYQLSYRCKYNDKRSTSRCHELFKRN